MSENINPLNEITREVPEKYKGLASTNGMHVNPIQPKEWALRRRSVAGVFEWAKKRRERKA